MITSLILFTALLLDLILGETKRFHPLVGFGYLANKIEAYVNRPTHSKKTAIGLKLLGALCCLVLVLPLPIGYYILHENSWPYWCLDAVILYLALAYNSLVLHAKQILIPLQKNDLPSARHFCSYLVSRDTRKLNQQAIARATTESVLENGHDAVIASLVWFTLGGIPAVILHRLVNTLDAMWGYRNSRFVHFGYFSAKFDDLLGWPSAKITSLLYSCQGDFLLAMKNAYQQGRQYKSLNGGWVMAAGATVLKISLGGQASYHGKTIQSVTLGVGPSVNTHAIATSLTLVRNAAIIFIISYLFISITVSYFLWP